MRKGRDEVSLPRGNDFCLLFITADNIFPLTIRLSALQAREPTLLLSEPLCVNRRPFPPSPHAGKAGCVCVGGTLRKGEGASAGPRPGQDPCVCAGPAHGPLPGPATRGRRTPTPHLPGRGRHQPCCAAGRGRRRRVTGAAAPGTGGSRPRHRRLPLSWAGGGGPAVDRYRDRAGAGAAPPLLLRGGAGPANWGNPFVRSEGGSRGEAGRERGRRRHERALSERESERRRDPRPQVLPAGGLGPRRCREPGAASAGCARPGAAAPAGTGALGCQGSGAGPRPPPRGKPRVSPAAAPRVCGRAGSEVRRGWAAVRGSAGAAGPGERSPGAAAPAGARSGASSGRYVGPVEAARPPPRSARWRVGAGVWRGRALSQTAPVAASSSSSRTRATGEGGPETVLGLSPP